MVVIKTGGYQNPFAKIFFVNSIKFYKLQLYIVACKFLSMELSIVTFEIEISWLSILTIKNEK